MLTRYPLRCAARPGLAAALLVATVALPVAHATENRGSVYAQGTENFLVGNAPPPGKYALFYVNRYSADEIRGGDGKVLVAAPNFDVKVNAIATRLAWVTDHRVAGANLMVQAILPYVDLKLTVPTAGGPVSDADRGLGDVTLGVGLAWHHSERLHSVLALDYYVPTGAYSATQIANIGRNHSAWQPVYAVSYGDARGVRADLKLMYTLNQKNRDTGYRSGQEAHADYAVGWGFGNGLVLGAGGYVYRQLSGDRAPAGLANAGRGRAYAIGPSLLYQAPSGWFITAKWQQEGGVRNRSQGDALWLKTVVPLRF